MNPLATGINEQNTERSSFSAPPPYTSTVYKTPDNRFDPTSPPTYNDVTHPSVTYINNYPGPPLTDGHVQMPGLSVPNAQRIILSKRFHRYLVLNGFLTILLGCAAIGIQIGVIVSKSILFFYYGFWGGAVILSIGLNTLFLHNHSRAWDDTRLFRSFVWQAVVVAILFAVGVVIIFTDQCNDNGTEDGGHATPCRKSNRFFNGLLIAIFGLTLAQSILNASICRIIRHRHARNANPVII